ncbi:hypothetical protein [Abyssisolibacter fermentans]|uniref:hypothetical protein n=1 Tax=Abyssisolibacter fermentans TaxID=1766203 RepID=UPI00082CCCE8|nr:hypothetical protein [Abyssisolibacter fermentans]
MEKRINIVIVISLLNWLCAFLVLFVRNRPSTPPLLAYYITLWFIFSLIPAITSDIFAMFLLINDKKTIFEKKLKLILTLNTMYLVAFIRIFKWKIG